MSPWPAGSDRKAFPITALVAISISKCTDHTPNRLCLSGLLACLPEFFDSSSAAASSYFPSAARRSTLLTSGFSDTHNRRGEWNGHTAGLGAPDVVGFLSLSPLASGA